ncbi:hypothetical protein E4634_02345 [Mangrovimicrobium sediminis]|uniref:Kazal-like domain-containing protein n=1 Tax=Mangrovimicrobium sediminis TaxID=2562682 RepID=A0A4Z0M887_9GAMM|nr:hypothetical protein [Haliea sp. SAOS-164]TGD75739.1 hypothetical protein E4634_02345 [Haliea sp. SAOS-164]
MRIALCAVLACLLAGCASKAAVGPSSRVACTEPRPQVCTMEYDPVCAELATGGTTEASSPCNACARDDVVGYSRGQCE